MIIRSLGTIRRPHFPTKSQKAAVKELRRCWTWSIALDERHLWNLEETLFWIALRDLKAAAKYILASKSELSKVQKFHECRRTKAYSLMCYHPRDRHRDTYWDAIATQERMVDLRPFARLPEAALAGRIVALAFGPGELERRKIPSDTWSSISLSDDESAGVAAVLSSGGVWTGVMFDRLSVIRAFPSCVSTETSNAGKTIAAERKAEMQLRQETENWLGGNGPVLVRAHWRPRAKDTLGVSGKGADRIWSKVAADFPALSERKGKPRPRRVGS